LLISDRQVTEAFSTIEI